jgi:hypothetical protein
MPHNLCQWLAYIASVFAGALVASGIQYFFLEVLMEPVKLVRKTREKVKLLQERLTGTSVELYQGQHPILGAMKVSPF